MRHIFDNSLKILVEKIKRGIYLSKKKERGRRDDDNLLPGIEL